MYNVEKWIENDYNPFILFGENGRVISLNNEAQYFLGKVSTKEIFEIAKIYASINYGYKTTLMDMEFNSYRVFGFTIGYEDDKNIGIRLYKCQPRAFTKPNTDGEEVNIYSILDLCTSAVSTQRKIEFKKDFDPTLPNIFLHVNNFTKLITKCYQAYSKSKSISTRLYLQIGEYIKFNDKKYPIFTIEISGDAQEYINEKDMQNLALSQGSIADFKKNSIHISSPLISPKS